MNLPNNTPKTKDLYTTAHLVVAAIRVLEHQNAAPPSVEQVCEMLSFSSEQGYRICGQLRDLNIITLIEGAYGNRLSIIDHGAIENIEQGESESKLDKALKDFQSRKDEATRKVEAIKAEQDKKKQNLFADLEKQLKTANKKKT